MHRSILYHEIIFSHLGCCHLFRYNGSVVTENKPQFHEFKCLLRLGLQYLQQVFFCKSRAICDVHIFIDIAATDYLCTLHIR